MMDEDSPIRIATRLVEESSARSAPAFSHLLSFRAYSEAIAFLSKSDVYIECWGGYPYSDRRMVGVDAYLAKSDLNASELIRDGTPVPALPFPLSALLVRAATPSMRLNCAMLLEELSKICSAEREIGDILTLPQECAVFATESAAESVSSKLTVCGKTPVLAKVQKVDAFRAYVAPDETTTIASNRLDATVAACFRLSREDARYAVQNAMVALNGTIAGKPAATVNPGDTIALATRSRIRVSSFDQTAKGRIRLTFARFGIPRHEA